MIEMKWILEDGFSNMINIADVLHISDLIYKLFFIS